MTATTRIDNCLSTHDGHLFVESCDTVELVQEGRTVISRLWSLLVNELESHATTTGAESCFGIISYPEDWEDHYVYHTWLPKPGRQLSQPLVIEHYRQGYSGVDDDEFEVEIYIPIE